MSKYARFIQSFLLAFIIGIALGASGVRSGIVFIAVTLAAFLIAYIYLAWLEPEKRFSELNRKSKFLILFTLGLLSAFGRMLLTPPMPELPAEFKATVVYDSVPTEFGSMLVVDSSHLIRQTKVYTDRYPEFMAGDIVEVKIKKNELAKKYIVAEVQLLEKSANKNALHYLNLLKRKFKQSLQATVPEPQASFAAGTVVGGSASLPEEVRESFRVSGISHILAASGYNFTLLLIFAGFLLRPFSLKKGLLVSLLIIPCFAIIAGASPAVLRAAAMGGLANFAILSGRISVIKNALLWAAAIMLSFDPLLLSNDLGFQLSFLATVGLIFLVPVFEKMFKIIPGQEKWWQGLLFATLAAQIMTAPLIAKTFGTVSLVALPVNLLVVPLVPPIMVLSLIASTFFYIWPAVAAIIAAPIWLFASLIMTISAAAAQFTWSQIFVNLSAGALTALYLIILGVILYAHLKILKHKHAL